MKNHVKVFFAGLLVVHSTWGYSSCDEESSQLIQLLEQQVLGELSAEKRQQAIEVARFQCEKHLNSTEKSGDAFTDFILSGEQANKDGNKRLKRMSR